MTIMGSSLDNRYLYRQGWMYSVLFHTIMGAGIVALVSGLSPSVEMNSFQWNVALVESSTVQPAATPPLESTQQQKSSESVSKPVQPKVIQHKEVPPVRPASEIVPVDRTATTETVQTVYPQNLHEEIEPETAQESLVQEEPLAESRMDTTQEPAPPTVAEPAADMSVPEPSPRQATNETAVASAGPSQAAPSMKSDYGWLMKALLGRINELKHYPYLARINHWEGKVVLRAVIRDDGQVLMVDVQESSGRSILDNDAIETLRKASPLKLEQPLGKPQVAILMPISYSLR